MTPLSRAGLPLADRDVTFVIADLAGFTALTEIHGSRHAAWVVMRYLELVRAALRPSARLAERVGDAVLVLAPDAPAAVLTAVAVRDATSQEPLFPLLRIGIHGGPVVELGGSYFGTPLNLTARLAAYAAPDQILCTETVAAGAAAVEGLRFERLGRVALKNIEEPVAICEVVAPGRDTVQTAIDPVCQMRVETASAVSQLVNDGRVFHFCSSDCAQRFATRAERGA
jgi:class 3 adenylate cyclase